MTYFKLLGLLLALIFEMTFFTSTAEAISISTKRLYLSPEKDLATIYVVSEEPALQRCQIKIRDAEIGDNSVIQFLPEGKVSTNSPKNLIRFAPRRFEVSSGQFQNVKLSYRRRPGVTNGEYIGLVAIRCETITDDNELNTTKRVTLKPTIVLNVPVIVHTGDIAASASFKTLELSKNQIDVTIETTGNRAITGDLEIIEKSTGQVLASKPEMSIYWESPSKKVTLTIDKSFNLPLTVRFKEDPKFGGNLLIEQQITAF
ncbi:hypothetical protein RS130_12635 [Paraglaciecola aquimarina]|uniref:P pilus assembly protein, chaperone PapD n=1 Tax=Paraglaciecola aquimarina TaxID=1235557 RepID=A0ABU3SXC3_9ALTE|nr:hypothetical protein [Paraglaciecola aquimarina]MDU0354650.1 hypothetical protein [Paraglaciecola aquimarina]